METPIRRLEACVDSSVAGGKAAGLARLLQAGFRVPAGFCVVAEVYQNACRRVGIDPERDWRQAFELPSYRRNTILSTTRSRLLAAPWPDDSAPHLQDQLSTLTTECSLWAVRSSATNEDTLETSGAGLYRTKLGVQMPDLLDAVRRCWASLWEERVFAYFGRRGLSRGVPAMAVIVQPMLAARAAGVAFSRHPVFRRDDGVLINAVPGLAEPLVSGQVMPDEYLVPIDDSADPPTITSRIVADRSHVLKVTPNGLIQERLPTEMASTPTLTDEEASDVAGTVRSIEKAFGQPVDVEWALDEHGLWILQARPLTGRRDSNRLTPAQCAWSRANFKETFPEVPSPLGLSFLERFMEDFILRHYLELGCSIPPGMSAVRVVRGRPFINVTLFQSFLAQLGRPHDTVMEQMGGAGSPEVPGVTRLPMWTLLRALRTMHRKIGRALSGGPRWFDELTHTACGEAYQATPDLSVRDVLGRMESLGRVLQRGECTFAIVAAVGQALQILGALLPGWLGSDWRSLLNDALQGQGTIISARQIHWLRRIAALAREDRRALTYFRTPPWDPRAYRDRLAGTACLTEMDVFLREYGHRAIGESDLMSPRFSEDPSYLLGIVRGYVVNPSLDPASHAAGPQPTNSEAALKLIRRRLGWRYDRWLVFRWWFARLCRAFELREANRHALMHYSAATRRLTRHLGHLLAVEDRLSDPEDVFFLTIEELGQLNQPAAGQDWKPLVSRRRAVYRANRDAVVPDFIAVGAGPDADTPKSDDDALTGIPISTGTVEGRICVIRSAADLVKLRRGDIVVLPVIDPGLVSIFGLAGGLIAEMGGTLSHGAIVAREYGIPAVVNVLHATQRLTDGDYVRLYATTGRIDRSPA